MNEWLQLFGLYPGLELWNIPLLVLIILLGAFHVIKEKDDGLQSFPVLSPRIDSRGLRKGCMVLALICSYLAYGSPIYAFSDQLFTAKIIQQILLFFTIPPLLILGLTERFWNRMLWNFRWKRFLRWATHPFIALILFQGLYSVYLIPSIFNWLIVHSGWEMSFQALLFLLSLFMWWPVFSNVPDINKMRELPKVLYIFTGNFLFIFAVSPILLTSHVLYHMPHRESVAGIIQPLADLHVGAALTLILHEIILTYFLGWVVISWFKREDKIDPMDVSGQLGVRVLPGGKIPNRIRTKS